MNKKICVWICAWLAAVGHALAADGLRVADFSMAPGETKEVAVELVNSDDSYIMLEFWMQLPDGVTIDKDDDSELLVTASDARFTKSHVLEIEAKEGNSYKVLIYSSRNAVLKGSEGTLFTMSVTASASAATGTRQGRFYSQVFANADKQEYDPAESTFNVTIAKKELRGDVNGDGKVTIADVTALVNIILGK